MPVIYLDTCIFIDAFESADLRAQLVRRLFFALENNRFAAVTSELTLAELLAPIKNLAAMSRSERRAIYLPLFEHGRFVETRPVSRTILLETAALRQKYPQRLPVPFTCATALDANCRFFMSQDKDARRLPASLTWIEPDAAGIATVMDALRA